MQNPDIIDVLFQLIPFDIVGPEKCRIGPSNDGGYIMLNMLRPSQKVISYGLSWNIGFELDLAKRGHEVFMFDHTIERLTMEHSNFRFFKEGIADFDKPDENLYSIKTHLNYILSTDNNFLLKIDVEGAEVPAIGSMPSGLLDRFEQIVVELHDLCRIADKEWRAAVFKCLSCLSDKFTLFHVHANNCAPVKVIDGYTVADVLELSYVRSDLVKRKPSSTLYPTNLDAPNNGMLKDHLLWFFPFEPSPGDSLASILDARMTTASRLRIQIEKGGEETANPIPEPKALKSTLHLSKDSYVDAEDRQVRLNILLVSVHPVLEFDETTIYEQLGCNVFSLGFYTDRNLYWTHGVSIDHTMRSPLIETAWHRDCLIAGEQGEFSRWSENAAAWKISSAFIDRFDVVIVHHNFSFIEANWSVLKGRRVIWRTIGQELEIAEALMRQYRDEGVEIVRWSKAEEAIPGYIGRDMVIRAAKNPGDWCQWSGETKRIVTFNNDFKARAKALNFEFHHACIAQFPFDLFGLRNDNVENWRGFCSYEQQKDILRSYRAVFVTGTAPAPYTLGFIEAWMTGIPVVHVGRHRFLDGKSGIFEIDDMIEHGVNGFLVNTVSEARDIFTELLANYSLCQKISTAGRASAIHWFGVDGARDSWRKVLLHNIN